MKYAMNPMDISWQDIQKYASDLIPVIRKNAPNAIIIVGTPNWSQMVDQAAANPIQEENVMYALHFYAATHKEDLRNKMVQAIQNGLPIFVSEFGICDASGNGSIDEQQANEWIQVMNQYDVSYVAWNLSNKDETSALLNKSCTKTSAFTIDDLSESGRWLYSTLTNTQVEQIPKETFVSNEIEYEYSLKNSWETNGTMYYQYELILSSHQNVDTWTIEIPFEDEFELSESWNGIYRVDGKNLIISNESYNGHIDETSKVKDVGFIATNKIKLHE